ncbi:sensor histidine kinase [Actinokineospora sp. NBRC 105648]|uniref:sensor histidine kinase n=1 Tax=Actinokineospora sp. NBRC 105648 TaxID=3032206 RepID=UPI0024A60915|nr:sensor histidine kinase [Actinokineospora sp. NBRC 105648]GLZ41385.1 two-component sensor histidine kinase [Actinokineospora sp. NBRC 105648]
MPTPTATFTLVTTVTTRLLTACPHLLALALLVLPAVRDLATAALCAATAIAYALTTRHPGWLAPLSGLWLVLLALTPDGIWFAFPLYFAHLRLLPARWAVPAVVLTAAAAIGGFGWHRHALTLGMVVGPALGAAVAVATVLGYQRLHRESERRRELIEELTATRGDLAAAQHAAGVLAERERLAQEIHDTVAQGLASIQLLLTAAERTAVGPALPHVRAARQAAADNLAEARRFVRDWSPPDLDGGSLPAALGRLCATTAAASGLAVRCHVSGTETALPTTHQVALLRIAQSALANVVTHARAGSVELTLSYMDDEVALDVVDDGVGLSTPPESGSGFGLAAMRARARALAGTLAVESAPGAGTAVVVTLPWRPA